MLEICSCSKRMARKNAGKSACKVFHFSDSSRPIDANRKQYYCLVLSLTFDDKVTVRVETHTGKMQDTSHACLGLGFYGWSIGLG